MHDLAVFMAEGEGGEQTYAGAVGWFRKGAEFGIVDSQYNLGVLYEQGLGISPNLTEALYWFMVAAKNGDAGAPAKVMEISKRVSPEAVNHARVQSEDWTASRANAAAAIRDYQTAQSLNVTGTITPELIESLNARAKS